MLGMAFTVNPNHKEALRNEQIIIAQANRDQGEGLSLWGMSMGATQQ